MIEDNGDHLFVPIAASWLESENIDDDDDDDDGGGGGGDDDDDDGDDDDDDDQRWVRLINTLR